jgi:hypothetical protein
MIANNEFISFFDAMSLLTDRLDERPSDEEFWIWCFWGKNNGGIDAYEGTYRQPGVEPDFQRIPSCAWSGETDIKKCANALIGWHYLRSEIESFYPVRYLTAKQLINRWSILLDSEERATVYIQENATEGLDYEDVRPRLRNCFVGANSGANPVFLPLKGVYLLEDILAVENYCHIEVPQPEVEDSISLEYGSPELPRSDAVGFYQAKELLGDDWSDEEFALFVMESEIRVFENSRHCELLKPVTNIKPWLLEHGKAEMFSGDRYDIDSILSGFKYSKTDLSSFKPSYRYVSFAKACETVAERVGSTEKAARFLLGNLRRSEITIFHPFVGAVTEEQSLNGERYRLSYFQDWKLKQLIDSEFGGRTLEPISTPQTEPEGSDGAGSQVNTLAVQMNSNDSEFSGLLNVPQKTDAWFCAIDDMTRVFHSQNGKRPNEFQAWAQLTTNAPCGYAIEPGTDRGEDCLNMPGEKPLGRGAFSKRWKNYTANKT